MAAVAGASAAFLCSALILLDRFAAHSPFLTYHLGSPRLAITWPSGVSMALGVALLGAVPGRWLRNAAIAVAILFVLRTTVLQAESKMVRALLSINRSTGQVAWTAEAFLEAEDAVDRRNSPATPTPVTDGERIYAYFGNAGLMCVSRGGAALWTRTGRRYEGVYGIGFSPVLSNGTIVLGGSTNGRAEITAIDAQSGAERWKTEFFAPARASGNNRTSLIERIGGRDVVLFWDQALIGLDLSTGRTLWRHEELGGEGDLVASLLSDEDRVYLVAAEGTRAFNRVDLELPNAAERWKAPARGNCVSPVLCGSRLLAMTDHGVLAAVDRNTGVLAWRHRLPGDYLASPISADGLAYFTNTEGTTTVITCEGTPRVVAENHLDEGVTASAAASDGEMYVRTASALYCIREEHKSH
jgi:outer membrane protein assembly factor BamB